MKLLATTVVGALCTSAAVAADQRPRDLYLDPGTNPGAKVSIELQRDGKTLMVPPDSVFKTGDRIRFHLDTNFDGYLFVFHRGSTGQDHLLFPYAGVAHRVAANAKHKVPNTGWMVFDENAGQEQVLILFSARTTPELERLAAAAGATDATATGPAGAPTGPAGAPTRPASASGSGQKSGAAEEREVLDALNARGMKERSRDLRLQVDGNDGYVLAGGAGAQEPLILSLALVHK